MVVPPRSTHMTTEITTHRGVDRALYALMGAERQVLTICKCLKVTYTTNQVSERKHRGSPRKENGNDPRGLGSGRAWGEGEYPRCLSWQPPDAGAAGTDSLIFQKKLQILTFNVTLLISGSICCNIIELHQSLGFSGSWASCL